MTITTLAVEQPSTTSPERRQSPTNSLTSGWRITPIRSDGGVSTRMFEQNFARQLACHRREAPTAEPRRSAITVLATALRAGTGLAQILTVARGLTATDLAVAYDHVEALRVDAVAAFDELLVDPTADRFDQVEERLGRLFPALVSTLRPLRVHDVDAFSAAVHASGRDARAAERDVAEIDRRLESGTDDANTLLGLLDDGGSSGLHHHRCFRPVRVGDIVPSRLADLLAGPDGRDS